MVAGGPSRLPGVVVSHERNKGAVPGASGSLLSTIGGQCVCRQILLSRITLRVICHTDSGSVNRHMEFGSLSSCLGSTLLGGKVRLPCRFAIISGSKQRMCHYTSCRKGKGRSSCARPLFRGSPPTGVDVMGVRFPKGGSCVFSSIDFVVPSVVFALMLLVAFVFAVCVMFHRGGLARVGGSFVGGVARRFGAPVSAVSLTTRVLGSPTINGSPRVFRRVSKIVGSRAGQLHFRIRGILRVSVFSHRGTALGVGRVSTGRLVAKIVGAFALGIRQCGNGVASGLRTASPIVFTSRVRLAGIVFGLVSGTIGCGGPRRRLLLGIGA